MAKGFKHGGGGGTSLNFKVVGGTEQPENPGEHTIWVNTETDISGWVFSPEEPENPIEGLVWIGLGTASPAPFNALKKGGLYCFPTSCGQYNGNEWEKVYAYVYKDSDWIQFSNVSYYIAIYDRGVKNVPLTLTGFSEQTSVLNATLGKGGSAYIKTTSVIDITHNNTLNVTCSYLVGDGTFSGYFYARILNTDGTVVAEKRSDKNTTGTISLDISTLTGNYIVAVYAYNSSGSYGGSCSISKIELLE